MKTSNTTLKKEDFNTWSLNARDGEPSIFLNISLKDGNKNKGCFISLEDRYKFQQKEIDVLELAIKYFRLENGVLMVNELKNELA